MSFLNCLFNLILGPHKKPPPSITGEVLISTPSVVTGDIKMACKKVLKLLKRSGEDFSDVFSEIECAVNREELEVSLERLNEIMRVFFLAVPGNEHNDCVRDTLKKLRVSQRFESFLNSSATVKDAVDAYKTEIVKKLKIDFENREKLERAEKAFDKALISCYMSNRNSEIIIREPGQADMGSEEDKRVRAKKRSYEERSPVHKLSSKKRYKTKRERRSSKHECNCRHEGGEYRRCSNCRSRH